MAEEERKTTEEEIKEAETLIVNNSKDARFAKGLIQKLRGLYQMDKIVDIPLSEVKDSVDIGEANRIYKTSRGYVWEAIGGMTTFVEYKFDGLCGILQSIMNYTKKEDKDDFESYMIECVSYIMQAPIFAAMGMSLPAYGKEQDLEPIMNIGLAIFTEFSRFVEKYFANAEPVPETEEDIKENIQSEQMANALEILADAPLPPEDKDE